MSLNFPCFGKGRRNGLRLCFVESTRAPKRRQAGQSFPCLKEEQSPTLLVTKLCDNILFSFLDTFSITLGAVSTSASPGNLSIPQPNRLATPFHVQSKRTIPYMSWPAQFASQTACSKVRYCPLPKQKARVFPRVGASHLLSSPDSKIAPRPSKAV